MSHQREVRALRNKTQDHFEGKERRQMSPRQVLLAGSSGRESEKPEKNFVKYSYEKLMGALVLIVRKMETPKYSSIGG